MVRVRRGGVHSRVDLGAVRREVGGGIPGLKNGEVHGSTTSMECKLGG